MPITVSMKLEPTSEQIRWLQAVSKEYIRLVNTLIQELVHVNKTVQHTSRTVKAELPSALKNQAIRDAKSVFKVYQKRVRNNLKRNVAKQKEIRVPVLRKPVAYWNHQNYSFKEKDLSVSVWIHGKSQRIRIKPLLTEYQTEHLKGKLGSLRIVQKSGKWFAQIAVETPQTSVVSNDLIMGVDLGLKVPAVAVIQGGKTKFFGNGRQNKFIKRKHRSVRRRLGKLKKLDAIRKRHNKEQRWMRNQDHQISRQIIQFAVKNHGTEIHLERLANIRNTARTSRKNEKNLHTWSFYRLSRFIEYKAQLAGIRVVYVNPAYTSQRCPQCGKLNHAQDRFYICSCGYHGHRDRVGALNIMEAPETDGHSLSA